MSLKRKIYFRIVCFIICFMVAFYSVRFDLVVHAVSDANTVEAVECEVTLIVDSSWENGYQGHIVITNNSSDVVSNWKLSFQCEDVIYSIWNGDLITSEAGVYEIECLDWNNTINPGSIIEIGLCANGIAQKITNAVVYKETVSDVVGEDNENGISLSEFSTEAFINMSAENMQHIYVDLNDNDADGINNYYESFYGTDMNLSDTDGDLLSDYEEIIFIGTDPTKYDTDGNEISDGEEGFDEDGLNTIEESKLGTSATVADSDGDGLDDGYKVSVSLTNPLLYDTDEDTYSDAEELNLGLDSLLTYSDADGVPDNEENILQSETIEITTENSAVTDVTVNISAEGSIDGKVYIENTYETDTLSANVVGLVGCPVSIETFVEFDTAEIVFTYDESMLGETDENDLCVMWYDEENREYILLEDSVCDAEANTVSYVTTHFSTYLLVDKQIWLDTMRQNIDYSSYTYTDDEVVNYDIIIALDYTMSAEEVKE